MLYRCQYCDKGASVGLAVSHAKNRSRKISKPNLHWKRVVVEGERVRMRLCAKCIRSVGKGN